jgi:hypothetical protein
LLVKYQETSSNKIILTNWYAYDENRRLIELTLESVPPSVVHMHFTYWQDTGLKLTEIIVGLDGRDTTLYNITQNEYDQENRLIGGHSEQNLSGILQHTDDWNTGVW